MKQVINRFGYVIFIIPIIIVALAGLAIFEASKSPVNFSNIVIIVLVTWNIIISLWLLSFLTKKRSALEAKQSAPPQDSAPPQESSPRHENDGEKGFSLAEVMVAAGLLSVLSLALVHITQNQAVVQKRAEASSEINTISNTITQNLLNSLACEETLTLGSTISEGMDIAEIKNRRGDTLFNKVDKYGNRQISINDITLNNLSVGPLANGSRFGEANIIVTFEKLSKLIKGIKLIQKTFPVKISLSGANALLGCYSATENAVQTATEKSCESIGGTYNSASNVCDLAAFNPLDPLSASKAVSSQSQEDWYNNMMTASLSPYVKLIGDTMTGKLQVNADIETNSRLCINGECRTTFTAQLCPTGQVVSKVFTNGTVACADITCPTASTFFVGINASGAPKCKAFPTNTCSANQFVSKVDSDGTVHCSALPAGTNIDCGAGAIQKIDAAGNATCVNFPVAADKHVYGSECPITQYLRGFNNAGSPICENLPSSTLKLANGNGCASCPYGDFGSDTFRNCYIKLVDGSDFRGAQCLNHTGDVAWAMVTY